MEHNTEDRLRVGVITSSHGIKGEVKVYPTTDDNDRFKTLKKCYLSNGRETLEVNCTSCKFLKNMVILKFKEYDNINDIERFKNYDILVDREDAVPLMDGEFFICDVLDADVYDQNDEHIGILDDVLETPANDVFVVKKDDGSEILIPVVPDFVFDVDTENRKVKVRTFEMVEADDSVHKTER
ncbi:MAG: 16S rRNA processing protein RimM [Coprococcus eutactus]|jgi:16S rRNA processing protein RimM|nr:16S rRNA processing protein RimM [Coprococcus eutactus]